MTHSSGKPHTNVGDRGQRYEVRATGYPKDEKCTIGWSDDLDGAADKRFAIHPLVARAFIGPPPTSLHEVAHNDGNESHNHFSNLRWATKAENQADRLLHGTAKRGDHGKFVKCRNRGTADMCARAEAAGVPVRRIPGRQA